MLYEIDDTSSKFANLHLEGNIIPHTWLKIIVSPQGKPDMNACLILSEIVYWYRPVVLKDHDSGQIILKKKYKADLLQKSYGDFENTLGLSKKQSREALIRLQEMGLVKRIFRDIEVNGMKISNVLFIQVFPLKIKEITDLTPSFPVGNDPIPKREPPSSAEGNTNTKITTEITNKNISELPFGCVASSFFDKLKKVNPKIRKPNLKKWAKEFELLSKDGDGTTVEEIEKVIDYALATHSKPSSNGFSWFTAIQSAAAFRKHFPQIWAQMHIVKTNKNEPVKNKEIADSIAKKFPRQDIIQGPDYIEFINGMYSNHIKFDDKEFKQKCLSELNKRKLKIEKL